MSGQAGVGQGDSRDVYENRRLGEIAARWDAKAAEWDRELSGPDCHLNEDEGYSRFLQLAQAVIAERKDFCRAQGIIDAGCGTGLVLEQVISDFAWGVGVDVSARMIEAARKKQIANARFEVGDCFDLQAFGVLAGAVISRGILLSHYGPEHAVSLLRSARNVLVPGGFLIFDFLNSEARQQMRHAPGSKTYYSGDEALGLAAQAGLHRSRILGKRRRRVLLLLAEQD